MNMQVCFNVIVNVALPQVKYWPEWGLKKIPPLQIKGFHLQPFILLLKEENTWQEIRRDSTIITLQSVIVLLWLVMWSSTPEDMVHPWCLLSTLMFSALSSRRSECDSAAACFGWLTLLRLLTSSPMVWERGGSGTNGLKFHGPRSWFRLFWQRTNVNSHRATSAKRWGYRMRQINPIFFPVASPDYNYLWAASTSSSQSEHLSGSKDEWVSTRDTWHWGQDNDRP